MCSGHARGLCVSVHPHARGDNWNTSDRLCRRAGSPPRPWGQLAEYAKARWADGSPPRPWGQSVAFCRRGGRKRFTPTPVGTMSMAFKQPRKMAVHPHARGDNCHFTFNGNDHGGSPPRPWGQYGFRYSQANIERFTPTPVGTMSAGQLAQLIVRFTPTPVGTMASRSPPTKRRPVHPHARGDNAVGIVGQAVDGGSPPRPWGQWFGAAADPDPARFTPTPVGTMRLPARSGASSAVHPHARGDNLLALGLDRAVGGSPPRPWGQSQPGGGAPAGRRFTPTPVGTMGLRSGLHNCGPVHPHARGDNASSRLMRANGVGSPPRPWGQYARAWRKHNLLRFTPTPVGTIAQIPAEAPSFAVHPHARGDNFRSPSRRLRRIGSHPRPWGQ